MSNISEVRRASLFNLLPTPLTLPHLLTRTLDQDPINRRSIYAHILSEVPLLGLTEEQREMVLKRGLGDRIEGVRKAAGGAGLVGRWVGEGGGIGEVSLSCQSSSPGSLLCHLFQSKAMSRPGMDANLRGMDLVYEIVSS